MIMNDNDNENDNEIIMKCYVNDNTHTTQWERPTLLACLVALSNV